MALEQLDEDVTTTIDSVVDESTELVLSNSSVANDRRNELRNGIRREIRRLFGQIEQGLTIEFRAASIKDQESAQGKALANIADLGRAIKFPEIAKEPMLLSRGDLIEGEIQSFKHSRKTQTKTTTTSKKESRKEEKAESKE